METYTENDLITYLDLLQVLKEARDYVAMTSRDSTQAHMTRQIAKDLLIRIDAAVTQVK